MFCNTMCLFGNFEQSIETPFFSNSIVIKVLKKMSNAFAIYKPGFSTDLTTILSLKESIDVNGEGLNDYKDKNIKKQGTKRVHNQIAKK